jgi:hypothetical protein
MSKQDNSTGNVIPLKADTATGFKVEPPTNHADRLRARGSRLHMRAGPDEDEKLVCLYDLVEWLVSDGGLPLVSAIDRVASEIEARDHDTFSMSQGAYAKPHNPDSSWMKFLNHDGLPETSLAASSVRVLGMSAFDLSKLMTVPGYRPDQSLEFDESKETPFEYFGRTDSCCYALTWRKAYELFGWGRLVYRAKGQAEPAIAPPAWWRDELELDHGRSKARYFLKADANTPLVRIVDVLADFAARLGLPTGEAMGDFLAAVNVPLLQEVYALREDHFAELVGAGFMYGLDTQAEAEAQSIRLHGVKDASRGLYPWAASPLEAFKRHIQEHGPQRSDRSLYAVSHATANRLWGWGEVVAAQAETQAAPVSEATEAQAAPAKDTAPSVPKKVKEKDMSPEWTGARLLARQNELKKKDFKDYASRTAIEAGLPARAANRRINEFKTGGVAANVADQLKAVGAKNKAA